MPTDPRMIHRLPGLPPPTIGIPDSTFDWSGSGEEDLMSKLSGLDTKFPPGLASKPYGQQDLLPQGPFPSERARQGGSVARNPIGGGNMLLPPGANPMMLLSAANALVQAKARARGDLIRGKGEEDALTEAMAGVMGVDPALVRGMPPEAAKALMGPMAARGKEEDARAREDWQTKNRRADMQGAYEAVHPGAAQAIAGIRDPRDASAVFDDAYRVRTAQDEMQRQAAEVKFKQENQNTAAGRIADLYSMDPDEALAQAPGRLAGVLEPGKPGWASTMQGLTERSRAKQAAAQREAQGKAKAEQREEKIAKEKEGRHKAILDQVDEVLTATPKYSKSKGEGGIGEEKDVADYANMHSGQLSGLKKAVLLAAREFPGIDQGLAIPEAFELEGLTPSEARRKILQAAGELKRRINEASTGKPDNKYHVMPPGEDFAITRR